MVSTSLSISIITITIDISIDKLINPQYDHPLMISIIQMMISSISYRYGSYKYPIPISLKILASKGQSSNYMQTSPNFQNLKNLTSNSLEIIITLSFCQFTLFEILLILMSLINIK